LIFTLAVSGERLRASYEHSRTFSMKGYAALLRVQQASLSPESNLWRHAAVRPLADHEAPLAEHQAPRSDDRDFNWVPVHALGHNGGHAKVSCPLPAQRCPFGGACHTCPAPIQIKSGASQADEQRKDVPLIIREALRASSHPRQLATPASSRELPSSSFSQITEHGGPSPEQAVGAKLSLLRSPWIESATEEDRHGDAYEVPPQIISDLEEQRRTGKPLEPDAQAEMQAAFDQNLGDVRTHADPAAHRLNRWFGSAAFTIGSDIFLGESVFDAQAEGGKRLLQHEIAHVARHTDQKTIRFWGGSIHKEITRTVATPLIGDETTIQKLEAASTKMDYRVRRLASAALPFIMPIGALGIMGAGIGAAFGGPGALVGGLIGGVAGLLATPLGFASFPPEGPEHGEGGQYEVEDIDAARGANLALQDQRLREAIYAYREWKESGVARSGGLPPHRVFEKLGDALHIAQDRGAHWEGAKGFGHDDPRHKHMLFGWSPDDKNDNKVDSPPAGYDKSGYNNAVRFTQDVLDRFVVATQFGSRILPPMLTPEESGKATV
jgi:hypothetical protein